MRSLRLIAVSATLLLAACGVDTTGIQTTSSRPPNPQSNQNAAVTVVEFADLQCPACSAAYERIAKPVLAKYAGTIRFEFRHFPLQSIHRYALEAAEASECAADQGKFWEFIDTVYMEQNLLSSEQLGAWAKDLDLDTALFDRCVRSRLKKPIVMADYDEGIDMDVRGTPTFFVNGKLVQSDPDVIGKAIEAEQQGMMQRL